MSFSYPRPLKAPLTGSWGILRLLSGAVALAALLLACEGETTGLGDQRIDMEGGTTRLEDGAVTLQVPSGAVSDPIWFTSIPTNLAPSDPLLVPGSTHEVGPPGTLFSLPVSLTISYDPAGLPANVAEEELAVFQAVGNSWILLTDAATNPANHSVTAEINTLGRFGVLGLPLRGMEIAPTVDTLPPGAALSLDAVPLGADGRALKARPVTWSTSDPQVALVDSTGVVTGVGEGRAEITASSGAYTATATIVTWEPTASMAVTPNSGMLTVGQTLQLQGTPYDRNGIPLTGRTLSWTSSNPAIASVTPTGMVTALSLGTTTISASLEGKTASATLSVHGDLAVVTGSLASGLVGVPYEQALAASGGDGTYQWSLASGSLPTGITLDSTTGSIAGTPLAPGVDTFSVQIQSAGQTAVRALSITVNLVPVASVSLSPSTADLAVGDTLVLSVTARDASGGVIQGRIPVWTSSDETVATISEDGSVAAVGVGAATVAVAVEGFPAWAAISVRDSLSVTDSLLVDGRVGLVYADTLKVRGGDGAYTWTVVTDSLPAGLTLGESTGIVTGTPTVAGIRSLTIQVTSGDQQADSVRVSINIRAVLDISTATIPDGSQGRAFTDTITATGGKAPFTWSISAGALPSGLVLNAATGIIAGTPTASGSSSFTVKVESDDGQTATKALSMVIQPTPVATVSLSPTNLVVTKGQSGQLTATVKDAFGTSLTGRSVTWASATPGVATVDGNGLVTGVAVGTTAVSATSEGVSGDAVVTVHAVLGVTTTSLAGGTTGAAYDQALAAAGGDGVYSWVVSAGALPAGLSLDGSTGVISGTPAGAGISGFTVRVSSGDGQVATKDLTITIS